MHTIKGQGTVVSFCFLSLAVLIHLLPLSPSNSVSKQTRARKSSRKADGSDLVQCGFPPCFPVSASPVSFPLSRLSLPFYPSSLPLSMSSSSSFSMTLPPAHQIFHFSRRIQSRNVCSLSIPLSLSALLSIYKQTFPSSISHSPFLPPHGIWYLCATYSDANPSLTT